MKFVQLILRKIIKFCCHHRLQILRLKCTKFDFGWGSAPDPAEGAYTVLPRSPSWISGAYILLRDGMGGDDREVMWPKKNGVMFGCVFVATSSVSAKS